MNLHTFDLSIFAYVESIFEHTIYQIQNKYSNWNYILQARILSRKYYIFGPAILQYCILYYTRMPEKFRVSEHVVYCLNVLFA